MEKEKVERTIKMKLLTMPIKLAMFSMPTLYAFCMIGLLFGTSSLFTIGGCMGLGSAYFIIAEMLLLSEEKYKQLIGLLMTLLLFGGMVYFRDSLIEAFRNFF